MDFGKVAETLFGRLAEQHKDRIDEVYRALSEPLIEDFLFLRTGEGALAHFQDSPPWEGVKTVLELAFARFPGLVLELAGAW